MATKRELTKAERISREERRLKKIYKEMPEEAVRITEGLVREAAYMRVQLEDYRADIDEFGYVEKFSQSESMDPYDRERPVARLYNSMNVNYQRIIKQLTDLLPKPKLPPKPGEGEGDGFDQFVSTK